MTPQEQKMLDDLIARVDGTQLSEKDPEAAQHIQQWLGRNPDAAYILAQTVLVQNYALSQAKAQIQSLQQHAAQQQQQGLQPARPTSFLGSLFGHHEEPRVPAPPPPQQPGYTQVPQYGAPQYGAPQPPYGQQPQSYPAPGSGGSSFLRSAATTAAGVAAGALAIQGVESLMHGFGHAAGFGGGYGLDGMVEPQETVINNYYDTPAPGGDPNAEIQQFAHEGDSDLSTQQDTAGDVNVDGGDQQLQTADADLPDINDDNGSFDDASYDDGGGFDDSLDNV